MATEKDYPPHWVVLPGLSVAAGLAVGQGYYLRAQGNRIGMKPRILFCLLLALLIPAVGCRKEPTGETTSLREAIVAGKVGLARALIAGGADVNGRD
ncbi:MAG: hypothetical protein ACYS74_20070, partial [Planctomycetota bacterium]